MVVGLTVTFMESASVVLCTYQVLNKWSCAVSQKCPYQCNWVLTSTLIGSLVSTELHDEESGIYVVFYLPGAMLGTSDLFSSVTLPGVSFHSFPLEVKQTFKVIHLVGFPDSFLYTNCKGYLGTLRHMTLCECTFIPVYPLSPRGYVFKMAFDVEEIGS